MRCVRALIRPVSSVLLLVLLPGCTGWKLAEDPLSELLADGERQIRVDTSRAARIHMTATHVSGDTLFGVNAVVEAHRYTGLREFKTDRAREDHVVVPVREITRVELPAINTAGTLAICVVVLLGSFALWLGQSFGLASAD